MQLLLAQFLSLNFGIQNARKSLFTEGLPPSEQRRFSRHRIAVTSVLNQGKTPCGTNSTICFRSSAQFYIVT